MGDTLYRLRIQRWLPLPIWVGLGLGAAALGAALGAVPLLEAAIGLLVAVLVVWTLIDPAVGLVTALLLGPTKPLTDFFVPALPLDAGQIALIVTLGAWFLHAARRGEIRLPGSPLNAPLFLFLAAAGLSTLNALSLGFALKELIKWVQLVVVMWLVLDLDRARWRLIIGAVLAAAATEALIGVWQFALRGDGPEHFLILNERFYRAYGTFEQPNPYGGFLGLTLPLAIGLTLIALERWLSPLWMQLKAERPIDIRRVLHAAADAHLARLLSLAALVGLLLAALLMSWSRGAWIGFAAAGMAIVFAWPRRWWWGALLVACAGGAGLLALRVGLIPSSIVARLTDFTAFLGTLDVRGVDINDANFAVIERLAHWQTAQQMARFNPWLGIGIGNYEPAYPGYQLLNWPYALGHAHNIYLNMLAEVGIIGLVAYAVLWASVLLQTWRLTRHAQGWQRGVAIGLLGTWTHLMVHQLVDKLYVANLHLHIGALLGVLSILLLANDKHPVESDTRE